MSGSEDTHSKWLRGSEVGIIYLLHRLNLFFFTLQLTRASTLHVVDLPFKEHHNFFSYFFQGRSIWVLPNKTLCQGIRQVSFPYILDDIWWDSEVMDEDAKLMGWWWHMRYDYESNDYDVMTVVKWWGNARHKWRDLQQQQFLQPPTQTQTHNTAEPTNTTQKFQHDHCRQIPCQKYYSNPSIQMCLFPNIFIEEKGKIKTC